MVLNAGPLDWESSALTPRPLLHDPGPLKDGSQRLIFDVADYLERIVKVITKFK